MSLEIILQVNALLSIDAVTLPCEYSSKFRLAIWSLIVKNISGYYERGTIVRFHKTMQHHRNNLGWKPGRAKPSRGKDDRKHHNASANLTIMYNLPILLFIVLTNLAVLIAILYDKRLQKLRNLPLISLALADILIGLICIPLNISIEYYPQDQTTCHSFIVSMTLFISASVLNLLVVCIERWIAIFLPLRYSTYITKTCIIGLVTLAWIIALAISITITTFEFKNMRPRDFCKVGARVNKHYSMTVTSGYFVACIGMGYMQFRVYSIVRSHRKRINPSSNLSTVRELSASDNQIYEMTPQAPPKIHNRRTLRRLRRGREEAMTLAVSTIYLVSILLWTPQIVIFLLDSLGICTKSCRVWFIVARTFMFLNSGINPLIYSIRLQEFRMAIKNSLCLLQSSSNASDSNNNAISVITSYRQSARRASV